MKPSARAARLALALSAIPIVAPAAPARAGEESLLIFSPSKLSSHAYRLRMGARAAPGSDAGAGVDLSVATSSTGRIRPSQDNARFWAEMRGSGASGAQRRVSAGYNPMTGTVTTSAGLSRRWIATPRVDVVVEPSVAMDGNARTGDRGALRVTQRAEVQAPSTGTALVATGSGAISDRSVGTSVALEQKLFDCLNLRAAVERRGSKTVGSVRARLAFGW